MKVRVFRSVGFKEPPPPEVRTQRAPGAGVPPCGPEDQSGPGASSSGAAMEAPPQTKTGTSPSAGSV